MISERGGGGGDDDDDSFIAQLYRGLQLDKVVGRAPQGRFLSSCDFESTVKAEPTKHIIYLYMSVCIYMGPLCVDN